jgi:AmmeMemoRadiSam system protein B
MRPPAVAGTFYPGDPAELRSMIEKLLAAVPPVPAPDALAYVVPHAGYRWSGPTAAHAYRQLAGRAIDRIVLVGPAHRVPLRGCAVPRETAWATPLGAVRIDVEGVRQLVDAGLAVADDRPHEQEHSLEVQLPLLLALGFDTVLPVCVGAAGARPVAELLAAVAGPGSVVLCSTDLSHYLTQAEAERADAATIDAITALAPERIGERDACGRHALRGLLAWARTRSATVTELHRATSGDEGGPADRVVGYLAAAVTGDAA